MPESTELLQLLLQLSLEIAGDLKDATFEELEQFVEKREAVLTALQRKGAEFSLADRKLIQSIVEMDSQIAQRMQSLQEEASAELSKVRGSRVHRNAYESSYNGESLFFDQKK
ncbi:protein FliT [Paenibacillus sp. UNCCL117]|uniref:flagellar protein FliT n=1 Tax=unclassified Paenibacillus TaxID=185978 RepID=UPI00088509A9|nr:MULTISPECIES: flagellar protein FliT [unclassified Paenibacillus]SDE50406.1 protein FliT [Paenibacillus sp. cl123]SFW67363.1 protein FliT [Paenibacillus sp. UNCCL117]